MATPTMSQPDNTFEPVLYLAAAAAAVFFPELKQMWLSS